MGRKKNSTIKKFDETIRSLPVPTSSEYEIYRQHTAPEEIYKSYLQKKYPTVPFYYENSCYTIHIGKEYYLIYQGNQDYGSNEEETSDDIRYRHEMEWFQEIHAAKILKDGFDLINEIKTAASFTNDYLKWIDEQEGTDFFAHLSPKRLDILLKTYHVKNVSQLTQDQRQNILNATERPWHAWTIW